jgi:peptidoglycan L-alanyl-D-glutamate endopeptidase CwlK
MCKQSWSAMVTPWSMRICSTGFVIVAICCCVEQHDARQTYSVDVKDTSRSIGEAYIRVDAVAHILCSTYPESIQSCDTAQVVFYNGEKVNRSATVHIVEYSLLSEKEYERKLNSADIDIQVLSGKWYKQSYFGSMKNIDPGRMRDEEFFKAMYGRNEDEVKKHLVNVSWMPGVSNRKILFTEVNSANKKLEDVSAELVALPKEYHKYVEKLSGTYVWRYIAGTNRLSAHSFGIAIDIDATHSDYWRWDYVYGGIVEYRNEIPKQIVNIFEKHGFIWGGRWYHYDTMHFEYRPEILYYLNQ